MKKYKYKYFTGIELHVSDIYPVSSYKGKKWNIIFKDLRARDLNHGYKWGSGIAPYAGKIKMSKFLIIEADSEDNVREAMDLICASWAIVDMSISFGITEIDYEVLKIDDKFKITPDTYPRYIKFPIVGGYVTQLGCIIASKASFRLKNIYAIFKLSHSFKEFSIPMVELYPNFSENLPLPTLQKPFSPKAQTLMSIALNSAYGSIEELGLEVRAIDRDSGGQRYARQLAEWGEKSLKNLINRLEESNIDSDETFSWGLRGKQRFIEKKRQTSKIKKESWAIGKIVRDEEVRIVDALADASFLRSQVTTHAFIGGEKEKNKKKEKIKRVKTLSFYDVVNVQFLARKLIIESIAGKIFKSFI